MTEHTHHYANHLERCNLCKVDPDHPCSQGALSQARDSYARSAPSEIDKNTLLARLRETEIAVAQAVEFAQYVEKAAKGAMVERARHFLSMKYSQELAKRLAMRVTHDEELVQLGYIGVYIDSTFNKEYMTICTFDGQSIPYEFKYQCVPVHIRRGDIRDG